MKLSTRYFLEHACKHRKSAKEMDFFERIRNRGEDLTFKGTVSRDFRLLVFFMNQFLPSP